MFSVRIQALASFLFLHVHLHTGEPFTVPRTGWLGFTGSTDLHHALTETMPIAQRHHVKGWMDDNRRLGAVCPKDLD